MLGNLPACKIFSFFYSAPLVLALKATCEEPEMGGIFLYSPGLWTPHLQEPDDSYPEVLYLQPRPRKWTHLWADLCGYVLVGKEQLTHRGRACSQSKANRNVWKGTFLPLVCFALSLIIHYYFLLPNIATNAAICCPAFLVDLADKYDYVFFPWLQQIFVDHSSDRRTAGL